MGATLHDATKYEVFLNLFIFATIIRMGAAVSDAPLVLIVAFDGLRPDFITEKLMPNLWRMGHEV